jgi:hypothetical protein
MKTIEIKKMSLTNIENKMSAEEMENIMAGSGTFCQGVYIADAVYGIGVVANWWNPVGWGGAVVAIALNGYCAFK